jgi:peptidyl-prolyl cis-trans isomerase SurA
MKLQSWAICALALSLFSCAPKASDIIVLEVGQEKVNLAEYENFFSRNSGGWETVRESSLEERERFLELLTNYKLKLKDAYDRNLLNDPDIQQELKEYRSSLAASYLTEKEVVEPGIQLMYERKKEEVRAMHILVALTPNAAPEDTVKAWNKAMDIIKLAKAGEPFESLAVKYSEDPSVKINHGDLYFFSGGQMHIGFENATYAMKKGEISSVPVRTPYGYHIIKVTDRQPARGSMRVRHIMARFMVSQNDSADTAKAFARIKGIQDSLKKGWDFVELAKKVSEDQGSQTRGGDLGWFERRGFVQPFDEAAFKMRPGEISEIVRTQYGYHIIRCDSVKPIRPFSDIKEDLKKQYQQYRFNDDYRQYIESLKKKFSCSINEEVFKSFLATVDSTQTTEDSAWDGGISSEQRRQILVTLSGKDHPLDEFLKKLSTRVDFHGTRLRESELKERLNKFVESLVMEEQSIGLENRYADFGMLMKEYQDGVVLFKAEQTEVWDKISISDSALKNFFNEHQDKFQWPARVGIKEILVESDTFALMLYDSLMNGKTFEELASRHNKLDDELRQKAGDRGMLPITTDTLTKVAFTMAIDEISQPIETDNGYSIIKVTAKEPARQKTFEEAGVEVSNVFQEYEAKRLQQEWIDRIRQKYPVVQHKEQLRKAFSSSQASR